MRRQITNEATENNATLATKPAKITLQQALDSLSLNPCTISAINLEGAGITSENIKTLTDALKENTTVTAINLNNNNLGDNSASYLAELIKVNKTIKFIHLENIEISNSGTSYLAGALESNSTIETINLSRNAIGDYGASDLADILLENKTIKTISLSDAHISAAGAEHLAVALYNNESVQSIDLSQNPLGDVGASHFSGALIENKTLTSINLAGCLITNNGAGYLGFALSGNKSVKTDESAKAATDLQSPIGEVDGNKTIQTINLDNNKIGADGFKALAEAISANEVVKEIFLNHNADYRLQPDQQQVLTTIHTSEARLNFKESLKAQSALVVAPTKKDITTQEAVTALMNSATNNTLKLTGGVEVSFPKEQHYKERRDHYKKESQEKSAKIALLEAELEKKSAEIASLKAELTAKSAEIVSLKLENKATSPATSPTTTANSATETNSLKQFSSRTKK